MSGTWFRTCTFGTWRAATWKALPRRRRSAGSRRPRGIKDEPPAESDAAVYGCTEDDPEPHFLGLLGEVDPDELFASGAAWGVTVRRVAAYLTRAAWST